MKKFLIGLMIFIVSHVGQAVGQEIPASIQRLAISKSKGVKIVKWVKDKSRERYISVLENASVIEIGMDGKWIRTTQAFPENKIPSVLKTTLSKYVNTHEMENFTFVNDAVKGEYYTADLIPLDDEDGDYFTLYVNTNGKIVGKEKI